MGEFPVTIVGGGPSGLLASALLTRHGIEHLLVEARMGLHRAPQAHVLNTRSLEIYRQIGVDERILEAATDVEKQRYITYFDQLTGLSYGALDIGARRSGQDFLDSLSPTRAANLPQDQLEEILFEKAEQSEVATIRFGTRCTGHMQTSDGVIVDLSDENGREYQVRTDYLISAEGAGSGTRRRMGFEMEGPVGIAHFITVYFKSDLSDLLKGREGVVHWCLNLKTPGILIVHDDRERSVLMIQYNPQTHSPKDFTEAVCTDYLRNVIGDESHPFEIKSLDTWVMNAQVAASYGQGRVFLVGDAAHRFPPTGGLGLNTGAQDVYNFIWKLREVLNGNAEASLLHTYETECRPIALANCQHSLTNMLRGIEVPNAIGLGTDAEASQASLEILRQGSPAAVEMQARIQEAIEGQLPHYVSYGLDLGSVYEAGALVRDGEAIANAAENPVEYRPNAQPGARLPHFWVEHAGVRKSVHDLLSYDGFTMIVGSDGNPWKSLLAELQECSFKIRLVEIGQQCAVQAKDDALSRLCGIANDGAILVRPDGHVAWREKSLPDNPKASLERAIAAAVPTKLRWRNDVPAGAHGTA